MSDLKELIHFVRTGVCHGSEKLMTEKVIQILTNLEDDELVDKCVKKIAGRTIASQEQWRHKMGIEEELQSLLSEIKGK